MTTDKTKKAKKQRALGQKQRSVLLSLIEYKRWSERCGWVWDTPSNTKKIMDSLVARGLVHCEDGRYTPTEEGRAVANEKSEQSSRGVL